MEPYSADDGKDVPTARSNVLETATLQDSEVDSEVGSEVDRMENLSISLTASHSTTEEANNAVGSEMDRMENLSISSTASKSTTEEDNSSSSEPSPGTDGDASETSPPLPAMNYTGNRSNAYVTPPPSRPAPLQDTCTDSSAPDFPLDIVPPSPPQTKRDNVTKKQRFVITAWKPVIHWTWKLNDDSCAICKRSLDVICMYCFGQVYENKECRLVTGKCGHAFHEHCLDFWLQKSHTCPLDNSEWNEKLVLSHRAYTDYELNFADSFEEDQKDPDVQGTEQESRSSQDEASSQDHDQDSNEAHGEA